jgi:hypothetical protein
MVFVDDEAVLWLRRDGSCAHRRASSRTAILPGGPAGIGPLGALAARDSTLRGPIAAEIERAIADSPYNARAHAFAGNLALLERRWADARTHFDEAARQHPYETAVRDRQGSRTSMPATSAAPRARSAPTSAAREVGEGDLREGQLLAARGQARGAPRRVRRSLSAIPSSPRPRDSLAPGQERSPGRAAALATERSRPDERRATRGEYAACGTSRKRKLEDPARFLAVLVGLLDGNSETSPPAPFESLSSMPMPGVAGAGAAGDTRDGLLAGLRVAAVPCLARRRRRRSDARGRGVVAATVVGATATVRCVTVAPRSTQRSGSSGQPDPANAEPADMTHAVSTAMARNGRVSFTNGLREEIPVLERLRLYIRESVFSLFL